MSAPRSAVVGDEHAPGRSHRERTLHGRDGHLGSHRNDDHVAPVALDELDRALEPVLVAGVEGTVGSLTHEQMVGAEGRSALRLGHPFDEDGDVHGHDASGC